MSSLYFAFDHSELVRLQLSIFLP
uniref:Uncharacterized protein n=1 Tax=Anguilla anguilla TaxID=7936 RepID=A0A0E9T8C2_ANGAN